MRNDKHQLCQLKIYLLFLALALLFLLLVSVSTSPLFGIPFGGDSAVFQTIGKYWSRGQLPYLQLWDHKGPAIYLLNAIGYALTQSKTGVFILQFVFLFLTEHLIYRILILEYSKRVAIRLVVAVLFLLLLLYADNGTEEYALPFLLASFYGVFRWSKTYEEGKKPAHPPGYSLLYGMTFGFCLLTRVTNAVGLCAAVTVITAILIWKRAWRNLLKNIGMFILGAAILIIPFVCYFTYHGILYDALYGTIVYNLRYAANASLGSLPGFDLALVVLGFSLGLVLTFVGACLLLRRRQITGIIWIVTGVVTSMYLFSGNGYLHYGLIGIPYLVVTMNLQKQFSKKMGRMLLIWYAALTLGNLYALYGLAANWYNYFSVGETKAYEQTEAELLNVIPESERNSVIAYNINTGFYLQMDIAPYYRFFVMQDWQASKDNELKATMLDTFRSGDTKWIFVEGDPSHTLISNVLSAEYELVEVKEKPFVEVQYSLFRRKE